MNNIMKAVFTIVDYGLHEQLTHIYKEADIPLTFISHGYGIADANILDYLGFGENKKIVVLNILTEERIRQLFTTLASQMNLDKPGTGITFSLPLSSMTTFLSSLIQCNEKENIPYDKEEESMSKTTHAHELIIAIVNKGTGHEVKNAATLAGAKGGTLIHALGLGGKEAQQFLGISIQPEKEIILIVVKRDERNKIMSAISEATGINTDGKGILFSLPVDSALGLRE